MDNLAAIFASGDCLANRFSSIRLFANEGPIHGAHRHLLVALAFAASLMS